MNEEWLPQCDEEECLRQFALLFPAEYFSAIAPVELAPAGWERSPLRLAFHPTIEQVYEEAVWMHRNIASLRKDKDAPSPEPTLAEVQAKFRETPIGAHLEIRQLLGLCLWDIFSDNHEVVTPGGACLDIGSFRGAAGFIADYINSILAQSCYDYMDFYMGSIWVASRADLTPVYVSVFRRLKDNGLDWIYHFPRLQLVDVRPLRDLLPKSPEPEWVDYSPEKAFAAEKADQEEDAEITDMRKSLDQSYREAIEKACKGPPPPTVQAYQPVFGSFPRGWPPAT